MNLRPESLKSTSIGCFGRIQIVKIAVTKSAEPRTTNGR